MASRLPCLQGEVMANHCSMWFIGLVFEKTNLNVDLTYDIQAFTKAVHYQAENTSMLREGMAIEYLSASLLVKRERTASGTKRKPSDAGPPPPAPVKKTKRLSESSTDEVSIISYNDDSNSSNVYELNLVNGGAAHAAEPKPAAEPEPAPAGSSGIACT
ncbi:hypothetical protein MSG28_015626 [Choristoneura fumiferana]|nr:hypothetical protein MSG28_015626 [Choristoneura fumiferana]KAI8433606.1 hypothetical protein MSG28_015626 [Choristoneura fumiferana]